MPRRIFWLLPLFAAALAPARDKPQNWLEGSSPHFIVVSNSGEKQVRHVAGQFERMRLVFHAAFPNLQVDPGSPIVVLAIKDEKDFRALEPQDYLGKGKLQLGGLFLRAPDKNYVLMRLDAGGEHPYAVVYHEYTHLLSGKAEEWLPLWLNEGLAEFFQNTEIRDSEVLLGEPSAENIQLLRESRLLPLPTLFTVDHTSPYYHEENKGSIFYAESWALTHYLEIKDYQDKTNRLADYATLVSQKVDAVTAATRSFGDLSQFQKSLEKYVEQGSFRYFKMPSPTQVDESAFQVRALPEIQADAVRADFLACNNRVADARSLLDEILHQDPNNVSAHQTMGFLAFRDEKVDEARKWYGEAVKLDSQSYLAHYYFAAMSMQAGSLSSAEEAQVESSLRTAIKLSPTFAPSYDGLAVFYGMRRRNLEEAHMLCLQAVQLDPANFGYRMDLANVLLATERGRDAVTVIRNAMNLAKSPAEMARAQMSLDQAQRYQEYQAARESRQANNQDAGQEMPTPTVTTQSKEETGPSNSGSPVFLHREEAPPSGPHHFVTGTIKGVRCSTSSVMDFDLAAAGQVIGLHSGNYFKIQFTAFNFTPTGDMKPCTQLEGMHAKVEYVEPSDKAARGWIVGVELRK